MRVPSNHVPTPPRSMSTMSTPPRTMSTNCCYTCSHRSYLPVQCPHIHQLRHISIRMVSISPLGPPHILLRGVNNVPQGVNNLPGPLRVLQRNGNICQVRCGGCSAVATIGQARHKFFSMVSSPGCHHAHQSAVRTPGWCQPVHSVGCTYSSAM